MLLNKIKLYIINKNNIFLFFKINNIYTKNKNMQ